MILNKASFNTVIGSLHYLWTGTDNDPEIIFLGTGSKSLDDHLKKITASSDQVNTETGSSINLVA